MRTVARAPMRSWYLPVTMAAMPAVMVSWRTKTMRNLPSMPKSAAMMDAKLMTVWTPKP
jgi:hypothetical protein